MAGNDNLDHNVSIKLMLENVPCKYKLNGSLEKLVGKDTATKQEVIFAIWEYIKVNCMLSSSKNFRTKREKLS